MQFKEQYPAVCRRVSRNRDANDRRNPTGEGRRETTLGRRGHAKLDVYMTRYFVLKLMQKDRRVMAVSLRTILCDVYVRSIGNMLLRSLDLEYIIGKYFLLVKKKGSWTKNVRLKVGEVNVRVRVRIEGFRTETSERIQSERVETFCTFLSLSFSLFFSNISFPLVSFSIILRLNKYSIDNSKLYHERIQLDLVFRELTVGRETVNLT